MVYSARDWPSEKRAPGRNATSRCSSTVAPSIFSGSIFDAMAWQLKDKVEVKERLQCRIGAQWRLNGGGQGRAGTSQRSATARTESRQDHCDPVDVLVSGGNTRSFTNFG